MGVLLVLLAGLGVVDFRLCDGSFQLVFSNEGKYWMDINQKFYVKKFVADLEE